MMRMVFLLFVYLLIPCELTASGIELAGEQDGVYEPAVYLVARDVVVREGRKLIFEPGAVIRFSSYAGIIVEGTMVCEGNDTEPIVFTSANDSAFAASSSKPQPFDWNGIRVTAGARVSFSSVKVCYSTFGIDADTGAMIELNDVVFEKNGRSNLVVGGEILPVDEMRPQKYVYPPVDIDADFGVKVAASPPNEGASGRRGEWKVPLRIALGAVVVLGGAVWAGFHYRAVDYNARYQDAAYPLADEYRAQRDRSVSIRNIAIGVCGAGTVAFGATFLF